MTLAAFASSARYRHFALTIFSEDELPVPDAPGIRYFVYQKEQCPETTRMHYQTYIQFKSQVLFTRVKRLFPTAHIERARSPIAARKYCMKEATRVADPVEWGTFRSQGSRSDLADFYDAIKSGISRTAAFEEYPTTMLRYRYAYDDVRDTMRPGRETRKVGLLLGPPGSGKTQWVWENFPDHYAAPVGSTLWMDGYDAHEVVLIDDYTGQYPLRDLLRLLHEYPERVPVKGGFVWFNPSRIIITSNLPPNRWYKWEGREELLHALERRIGQTFEFPLESDQESTILVDENPPEDSAPVVVLSSFELADDVEVIDDRMTSTFTIE